GRPKKEQSLNEFLKARFSCVERRTSRYSLRDCSFFGRPRFAIEYLYLNKRRVSSTISLDKYLYCGYNKSMNKLSGEKRTRVITALVEGCSINATSRMTGVAKNTVL